MTFAECAFCTLANKMRLTTVRQRVELDQALANRPNSRLGSIGDPNFSQNMLHMLFDRLNADSKRFADFPVAQAHGYVSQDLGFSVGQRAVGIPGKNAFHSRLCFDQQAGLRRC